MARPLALNTKEHLWALTVGSLTSGRYRMAPKINFDSSLKARINEIEDYIIKK